MNKRCNEQRKSIQGVNTMARTKQVTTVNADGQTTLTDLQQAEKTLKELTSTFIKAPRPGNYNALVLAARTFQAAYIAEFTTTHE